jgi:hypothetical protein
MELSRRILALAQIVSTGTFRGHPACTQVRVHFLLVSDAQEQVPKGSQVI